MRFANKAEKIRICKDAKATTLKIHYIYSHSHLHLHSHHQIERGRESRNSKCRIRVILWLSTQHIHGQFVVSSRLVSPRLRKTSESKYILRALQSFLLFSPLRIYNRRFHSSHSLPPIRNLLPPTQSHIYLSHASIPLTSRSHFNATPHHASLPRTPSHFNATSPLISPTPPYKRRTQPPLTLTLTQTSTKPPISVPIFPTCFDPRIPKLTPLSSPQKGPLP